MVGTDFRTDAAADADLLVDMGLAVFERDAVFRAVHHAGARNAAAAGIGHPVIRANTGTAGFIDNREDATGQAAFAPGFGFFYITGQRSRVIIRFFVLDSKAEQRNQAISDDGSIMMNTASDSFRIARGLMQRDEVYLVFEFAGEHEPGKANHELAFEQ